MHWTPLCMMSRAVVMRPPLERFRTLLTFLLPRRPRHPGAAERFGPPRWRDLHRTIDDADRVRRADLVGTSAVATPADESAVCYRCEPTSGCCVAVRGHSSVESQQQWAVSVPAAQCG